MTNRPLTVDYVSRLIWHKMRETDLKRFPNLGIRSSSDDMKSGRPVRVAAVKEALEDLALRSSYYAARSLDDYREEMRFGDRQPLSYPCVGIREEADYYEFAVATDNTRGWATACIELLVFLRIKGVPVIDPSYKMTSSLVGADYATKGYMIDGHALQKGGWIVS